MKINEFEDIRALEMNLKDKENQEIERFGIASLGTLAQQEMLRLIKLNNSKS